MIRRAFPVLLALAVLAGCGEPISDDHFTNDQLDSDSNGSAPEAVAIASDVPVRIGDNGLGLDACPWAGTTRRVDPGSGLPVRTAPADTGTESGSVPAGARFFVCARSLDQKWLGIVYEESGTLAARCGVSSPVPARAYQGPCRSGWVSSAFVKMIAGGPPTPNQDAAGSATDMEKAAPGG